MKNKTFIIFILMIVLIFSTVNLVQAAPTPVKVIAEGTTEPIYERQVPNGKASDEIGTWRAKYSLHTRLEFWNVGEEGGEKYAEGIITTTFINGIDSKVAVRTREHPEYGTMLGFEPSSNIPPDLPNYILKLHFSGGPSGVFSNEDGTSLQTKLTPDGNGGFTIPGTPTLVVQNPEAFKDWAFTEILDETEYEKVDETVKGTTDTGMRFDGLSGQVEYLLPGPNRDDWRIAKYESIGFPPGTHIKTSEDSSAILRIGQFGAFVLKPESEIVLNSLPVQKSKLKILAGQMWGNVKKMVNEGSMEIEMNQAVAGIKGTTFVLSEIDGVSSLNVIEGKVEFTAKSDGKKVNVTGGSMVSASNAGLSALESFDIAKETADWNAVMKSKEVEKSKGITLIYALFGVIFIVALIYAVLFMKNKTRRK